MLEFLKEKLVKQYGEEITNEIFEGYDSNRIVSLRVNTIKSTVEEIKQILDNDNIKYRTVSWSNIAFIIDNVQEDKIKSLEIYNEGKIYLQSLSSIIPPIVLNPETNNDILDMAAAPGGKTTELAAISNNKAHITACEMNKIRCERLRYNLEKQGATSVYLMQKDSRLLDDYLKFDKILLDAPCTGSGTINLKNNNRLEENFLNKTVITQEKLLNKAAKMLKKGGELVYSTCSILAKENELNVEKIIKKYNLEVVPINLDGMNDLPLLPCKIEGAMVIMPTKEYEGFFVIKLKKSK